MPNLIVFFFLMMSPVLYEGRYHPIETVPKGAAYTIIEEDYDDLAGKVYLQAEGKTLKFPTYAQLYCEQILYFTPFKWIILGCYLIAAAVYNRFGKFFLVLGFALHTLVLCLRCFVLSRPPVANMYETILYVPWVAMIVGFIFQPRAGACAAAAILLFLPSRLSLQNVQAVLDSQYWLTVHVLMVVGSYGVLCLAGVLGHVLLIKRNEFLEKKLLQVMYLGTGLLIGGTILGGVWAAQSWGRFWDWDPKEAWAFICSGLYLIWIHAYRFKKIGGLGLAIGAIIGVMAITFTWYGVNYILGSGLHSYGFGHGGEKYYYLYLGAEILFISPFFLKILFTKNHKIEKKGQECKSSPILNER